MTAQVAPAPPAGRSLADLVESQRAAFVRDGIPDHATRIDRVERLQAMVLDHADDLVRALSEDFGTRAREISLLADISGCMGDLDYQKKRLRSWMGVDRPARIAEWAGLQQRLRHDPLGVVGVMGPWNFPVQLTIVPTGSALAAGNRVVMRPSEVTARTAQVLADAAPSYFSAEELVVVTDDQCTGAQFAEVRWDHLFFTGSPAVGALVAEAAGRNLVPVTLELGGKNPVVVDVGADLAKAGRRVAASRMVNGGQVCMCPDYVFVPEEGLDEFAEQILSTWRTSFPSVVGNDTYTSVVNERHYDRITALIDDAADRGAVVRQHTPAGETLPDRASRKIAPTLLIDVPAGAAVERDEIFGPVLVLYPYRDLDEAIAHINARPHPLTVYWFGDDNERYERLQSRTRSGSVNGNDFTLNLVTSELPFGGVGASGSGAYHGRAGFDTFTHARAVTFSRLPVSLAQMMTPPFTRRDSAMLGLQVSMSRRRIRRARSRRPGPNVDS